MDSSITISDNAVIPKQNTGDRIFKWVTLLSSSLIIVLMAGFFVQLIWHSIPAIQRYGLGFITSTDWNPVKELYGAAPSIYGTAITTLVSMAIAVPLSFVISMFLVELAHPLVGKIMSQALDLLAAVPSIIFGMWGLFVFVPFMQEYVQPALVKIPLIGSLPIFDGNQMGIGYLTGGIILALMILPFMSAIMRDVFKMVPAVVKESAYGTGATTWEVTKDVTLKYGMQGFLGAVFLGLGRAIGETMAILFVIGNSSKISSSLFASGTTISATLANNFAEADGIFQSVLFELGLILLVMSFIVQIIAQAWLNKVRKSTGGGL